jgi:hypothetical protein
MQTIPGGVNSWYVDSVVPLVWHFCGEGNTKKLEKIQERALRFIYNDSDSSYENLLEKSQSDSPIVRQMLYFFES